MTGRRKELPFHEVLFFDLETTLDHKTVHMAAWQTVERGPDGRWAPTGDVAWGRGTVGIEALAGPSWSPAIGAHNLIGFDREVLHRATGRDPMPLDRCVDSLLLAQVLYPDHPGGHSLKALLPIVGEAKLEAPPFEEFSEEMVTYCVQDVRGGARLLAHLLNRFEAEGFDWRCMAEIENPVAWEVDRMEEAGFYLDLEATTTLLASMEAEVSRIEEEIQATFAPNIQVMKGRPKGGVVVNRQAVEELCTKHNLPMPEVSPTDCYRITPVNVNSRVQLADRLVAAGWEPRKYTPASVKAYEEGGKKDRSLLRPVLDEETLEESDIPQAKLLVRFFWATKIAAYARSWIGFRDPASGRVHPRVMSIGAPTARMAHSSPNIAQVPKVGNPGGKECRSCWAAAPGRVLVGVDASGLEFRMLAHYCQDEEMTREILEGDIHTKNQQAAKLPSRDAAKTFMYAWLYGAGPGKLASIAKRSKAEGAKAKRDLIRRWKGMKALLDKLERFVERGDTIPGLDGRRLYVRKAHAVLNTLLQSAGAIVMKQAKVLVGQALRERLGDGRWRFVANVHDEFQIECEPADAEIVREVALWAIPEAGRRLGLRVPLAGEAKVGRTWADTH
ncbi:bifunctional 3'-5' exonuclease/DNA polymerase [uncultured Caudovirales phage]|uniref:DNA-directed DNA polymerase n=1 Tax=uncultured Caudovirales phage TaxID=2100421 RepID=A0A6J5M303_9CAUD|nr:bifunctional 3'-5' exonuclease/DNA polymerase [uncultured Caudovirales phage]